MQNFPLAAVNDEHLDYKVIAHVYRFARQTDVVNLVVLLKLGEFELGVAFGG